MRQNLGRKFVPGKSKRVLGYIQSEPFEAGPSEDDRSPFLPGKFLQTRWDITAEIDDPEIRPLPMKLMLSPHTAGCNNSVFWNRIKVTVFDQNENVINWTAWQNGGDVGSRFQIARQILCTVHRNIDLAGNQGAFDFAGK